MKKYLMIKIVVFILSIWLILITFSTSNGKIINLPEDTTISENNNLSTTVSDNVLPEQNSEQQKLLSSEDAKDEVLLLENLDIDELYKEFLKGKINAQSSFSEEKFLTFYDEEVYEEESVFRKESLEKYFALVDVNSDQKKELIFKIHSGVDELMYILGRNGDKLVSFSEFETHTIHIGFTVFDNGITEYGQNHTGAEAIYYSYNLDGKPVELIRFFNTGDWESFENQNNYRYNAYCLNENKMEVFSLNTIEEYESLLSAYRGNNLKWNNLKEYSDVKVIR